MAIVAAFAASVLPAGNVVRLVLTLAILLTVPGYLLLAATFVPAPSMRSRAIHALVGIGVSPVVVGLLALSTAMMVGGYGATAIIVTVTLACLLFALVAFTRRSFTTDAQNLVPAPTSTP